MKACNHTLKIKILTVSFIPTPVLLVLQSVVSHYPLAALVDLVLVPLARLAPPVVVSCIGCCVVNL